MSKAKHITAILTVAGLCVHLPVNAQAQSTIDGFEIRAPVNVLADRTDAPDRKVCIPASTTLRVLRSSGENYTIALKSDSNVVACTVPSGGNEGSILTGVSYTLSKDAFENSAFAMRGITYGALIVPFKYQLTGDKQFEGGATIGGYIGYRFDTLRNAGFTATPIVFMGASNISVDGTADTSSTSLFGLTYGLGLIGTIQRSFQAGVVLGWDRVGSNEGYKYNGKPWIALQFGYAFLQ